MKLRRTRLLSVLSVLTVLLAAIFRFLEDAEGLGTSFELREAAMKKSRFVLYSFAAAAALLASSPILAAQAVPAPDGVPVSMVVTAEAHHGTNQLTIASEDVTVYQSNARANITDWVPLRGDHAGLELFLLLDDSREISQGSQLEDLRHFIMAQPASTKIGVAYMQVGGPKIEQGLTAEHMLAAKALHVSLGNLANSASPYSGIGDLIGKWPAGSDRREILMISNGVDALNGSEFPGRDDPYVDSAIEKAQRAGVVVFTIGASPEYPDSSRGVRGKNHLSQVAEETGGESYYYRSSAPASFAPYLDDATRRLNGQYLLTFLAKPAKDSGMQSVRVRSDVPHAKLVSAKRVYVPNIKMAGAR